MRSAAIRDLRRSHKKCSQTNEDRDVLRRSRFPKTLRGKAAVITVMRVCCKCGSKLLTDAPQGLCGLCLFKTALVPLLDESVATGHLSAVALAKADDGGSVHS